MMANKPSQLVPKLRFPEFRDAEEWEPRKLGEIADFFKGKGLPKSMLSNDGKNKCIHYGELFTSYPEVIRTVNSRTDLDENLFLSAEDDVLMPTSDVTPNGLAKACCVKVRDVIIGGDVLVVRTDQQRVYGEFLARYIRRLEQKVLQLVTGSTVYHLYATSLEKLDLRVPKRPEQQEIADCLGSLDDLIAAEGRKLEALRQHKQGLMQQLFPQPGETVPRLRFAEFLSGSTWDELTIADVCDLKAGDFIPASEIAEHADEGSFPCYGANGLRGYVKSLTHDGRYVLVGRQGALCGNVNLYAGKFHATEHALVATPKPGINTDWLFYALDVLKLNRFSIGQAQPGLSVGVLRDVGISVPIEEDEQQEIADCLGSLDDLIAAEGRKLEALRQHKQGLMQQLFPSLVDA